jgi:hypothetical protein
MGDTTNFGAGCGSCGGAVTCGGGCSISTPADYGQGCGPCGGTWQCDGSCSMNSTSGSGGPTETVNLDFNTAHCTANAVNFAWSPNFGGQPTNPSGYYTVNYNFTDHNNMSGSFSTVFYIGCSGNPTLGNGYSEAGLTTTQVGSRPAMLSATEPRESTRAHTPGFSHCGVGVPAIAVSSSAPRRSVPSLAKSWTITTSRVAPHNPGHARFQAL